jgi:hypothetical protein
LHFEELGHLGAQKNLGLHGCLNIISFLFKGFGIEWREVEDADLLVITNKAH